MSSIRRKYKIWTQKEIATLREMYGKSPQYLVMASLPGRTWPQIIDAAHRRDLTSLKPDRLPRSEVLKRKRENMARRRSNPAKRDQINQRNRTRYQQSEDVRKRIRVSAVTWRKRHFFAYKLRFLDGVTAKELWSLWKKQRGHCALSGRKLDRTAHLDHKRPKSRGGSSKIDNVQWLAADINYLKRHLTNEEFVASCRDVISYADGGIAMRATPLTTKAFPDPIKSNIVRWSGRRVTDASRIERFEAEVAKNV